MNLAQDDFTRMTLALLESSNGVLEPNHDPPEIQSDHIGLETWQDDNETDFDLSLMLNDDDEDSGSSCAEERPSKIGRAHV